MAASPEKTRPPNRISQWPLTEGGSCPDEAGMCQSWCGPGVRAAQPETELQLPGRDPLLRRGLQRLQLRLVAGTARSPNLRPT